MSHVETEREVCRCLTAVRKDAPFINNPRDPVRCPYREPLVYDAVISRADHPVQTTPESRPPLLIHQLPNQCLTQQAAPITA